MGKKLFSLCMALALCLGLLPATALADTPSGQVLYVGGVQIPTTGYWTTDSAGKVTQYNEAGKPSNNYIHYDTATNTLTLHNATIKESVSTDTSTYVMGAGIGVFNQNGNAELTIQLEGDNTIKDVSTGIFVLAHSPSTGDATLTIKGSGSLDASGILNGIMVQSNGGDATLTIQSADVTLTSNSGNGVTVQAGSNSSASLSVDRGNLTATGSGSSCLGIYFYGPSSPENINLTVSNNAIVRANGGIASGANLEGDVSTSGTGIVFDDNEGTVYGDVTLKEDLTIGEGESLKLDNDASLNAGNYDVIVDGGTVDGGIKNSLGDSVIYKVTKVELNKTSLTLNVGDEENLIPTITPDNATDKSVTWESSASGVATVSNGVVTAVTPGTATITVTTEDGGFTDTCEVTVTVPVTGVALDKTSLSLEVGDTAQLTATVKPDNATNKNVTWSSSAPSIAMVDANGKVTAVGTGTAQITVTTADGSFTAACAVTVEKPYTPPPYIPPTKTPSEQAIDKIEDAKEGSTVKITLRTGQTKLDKEVFEELAGRDVTLEISLPGGVTWTVNGEDIPKTADLTDLDMGVSLNTSTIPVDLINAITGEIGTVQLTLKHDGPFGFTMTLTAPVGKENKGLWANLYHYDEDAGEMVYQTAAQVDEDGNVALPFDHASQYALVLDSKSHDLPFTDLAANAWYTDAVAYVYRHDIMEGMSATTFQPNGTLSRAMAVQIFYNLEGQPDISDENLGYPYEDVDAQAWYGDAVYWARITGVATGYGDGTFQPGDSITRQEFAQMLYNYAKYKGYDLTAEGDLAQFPDSGSVADWAKVAMSWANGNKLINGHDNGTIDAAGIGTRAQAASILMNFDQNLAEK